MEFRPDIVFSLRKIRESKGLKQGQAARFADIPRPKYNKIEAGTRRPTIDELHRLASLYETSMDFLYHSFYMQSVDYHFPDASLKYGREKAMEADREYMKEHAPLVQPVLDGQGSVPW